MVLSRATAPRNTNPSTGVGGIGVADPLGIGVGVVFEPGVDVGLGVMSGSGVDVTLGVVFGSGVDVGEGVAVGVVF